MPGNRQALPSANVVDNIDVQSTPKSAALKLICVPEHQFPSSGRINHHRRQTLTRENGVRPVGHESQSTKAFQDFSMLGGRQMAVAGLLNWYGATLNGGCSLHTAKDALCRPRASHVRRSSILPTEHGFT